MPSLDGYSLNEEIKQLRKDVYGELGKVYGELKFIYGAIIKEGKDAKTSRSKQKCTAERDKTTKKDESSTKSKVRGKQA